MVATLTLAADHCPPRSEGFAFAILMSIVNLATSFGDVVGSFLYEHLFASHLAPLILVSAAFTAFAFILVPILHLGNKFRASRSTLQKNRPGIPARPRLQPR